MEIKRVGKKFSIEQVLSYIDLNKKTKKIMGYKVNVKTKTLIHFKEHGTDCECGLKGRYFCLEKAIHTKNEEDGYGFVLYGIDGKNREIKMMLKEGGKTSCFSHKKNKLKNLPIIKKTKPKKKNHRSYERLGKFQIHEVLDFIGDHKKECLGYKIKMNSHRYLNFKKHGTTCVECGLEGKYFYLERAGENWSDSKDKNHGYHFNLYGIDENGKERLMTKDHIHPSSLGGKDHIDNYQPMCEKCNIKKGSKFKITKDEEYSLLKEYVKKHQSEKKVISRLVETCIMNDIKDVEKIVDKETFEKTKEKLFYKSMAKSQPISF